MSQFILDPTSISQSSAIADLNSFIESRPDAAKWKDFFESSTGQTIIEMIAGMSAFLSYNNVVARRESYLKYTTNKSSAIAGAQYLGYSAFRGKNPHATITITPNFSGTINKFDIIGSVKDRDLVAAESKVVNDGVQTTIEVIVGNKLSEELTTNSSNASVFRFSNPRVSDDIRILIDGTEVETSDRMLDLNENKFVAQTNVFESVDTFYKNALDATTRYNTGSTITLEYIEYKSLDFELTDFEYDLGTLDDIEIINIFEDPETLQSIKFNAPLFNETQFTVRGRNDQEKIFRLFDTSIISSKGRDISPAVIELTYVRDDKSLFTNNEKQVLLEQFESIRQFGMLPPEIKDPIVNFIKIDVEATLIPNVVGDATQPIKDIVQEYEDQLAIGIPFDDIENKIEDIKNDSLEELIKIARIKIGADDWQSSYQYSIGEYVKASPDNGRIYRNQRIIYKSDSSEPSWPTTEGDTIVDGEIEWEAVSESDVSSITVWSSNTDYQIGQFVKPSVDNGFKYEAVKYVNKSGSVEPTWPELSGDTPDDIKGTLVKDGDILWIALPQEGNPPAWSSNTRYESSEVVVATDQNASDTVGVMFQALMFLGTSDSSQPSFPTTLDDKVIDGNIEWIAKDPSVSPEELPFDQYFDIEVNTTLS